MAHQTGLLRFAGNDEKSSEIFTSPRVRGEVPPHPSFSPQAGEGGSNLISAGVFGPLLLFGFGFCPRSRRKLKHCCSLAFLKLGQKDLLAVRQFQDIVMDAWLVLVPLPEDRGRKLRLARAVVGGPAQLDLLVEGKLGAGQDTYRRCIADRIVNLFESDRASSKIVAYQFVGDNCGTRFGVLKAEVAHDQTFPGSVAGDQPIAFGDSESPVAQ